MTPLHCALRDTVDALRRNDLYQHPEPRASSHYHFAPAGIRGSDDLTCTLVNLHHESLSNGTGSEGLTVRTESALRNVGCHEPGVDHRDAHTIVPELYSQGIEKTCHCVLCAGVQGAHRDSALARDARDSDDPSARALEVRQRVPRAVDAAEIIDARDAIHRVNIAQLVESRVHADSRIVDERVDSSELVHRSLDQGTALFGFCNIRPNCDGVSTDCATLLGRRLEQYRIASSKDEPRSAGCELSGKLKPDSSGSTRYYYDIVAESVFCHPRRN
jgi:hypothetical protein